MVESVFVDRNDLPESRQDMQSAGNADLLLLAERSRPERAQAALLSLLETLQTQQGRETKSAMGDQESIAKVIQPDPTAPFVGFAGGGRL